MERAEYNRYSRARMAETAKDASRHSTPAPGRAPARTAVDCPITTSGAAPLIVDGFRRVRRSTFTEGAIMERAEYNRHSRARMAETAKDASRHSTPDAPERVDPRRRCTGRRDRTILRRIARERVPTVSLRKRVEMWFFNLRETRGALAPATSHQPPATSHQPPATSHQPPATSHQPPATSHQPPATSHQQPLATSH